MTSTFAWLDNDDAQQRRMTQLIELFKEESTVDELGIGTIRDTFANELFPGTSVLQTRVRYLLFTAWLVRDVGRQGLPVEKSLARLRADEARLIDALLAGGEHRGGYWKPGESEPEEHAEPDLLAGARPLRSPNMGPQHRGASARRLHAGQSGR